jgi:hypothetical protein
LAAVVVGGVCATALATPLIDSAVINERIWNDADYSTFTSGNLYPNSLWMNDSGLDGTGWANRHNFRLSENGGISPAVFMNDDAFEFYSDVTITGTANAEGGLNLSPWWSQDVDGVFMLRTDDGEISCFGGRLPYYNFTASQGITYTNGDTVRLGMVYQPNDLSEADPATIEYSVDMGGTLYTSGPLAFDEGNPGEDPPYGLWGMLNDARLGGFFMPKVDSGTPGNWGQIDFENMVFVPEPTSIVLIGLAGLALTRRR